MSSPPSSGSDSNIPAPPHPSGVPVPLPDRGAGVALAGFLCGLISLIATMLGIFGLWVLVAAFPVALVGLILSFLGRHSTSRRWLAITGMVLSSMFVVLFLLVIVWAAAFWAAWSNCSHNQATGSCI